MWDWTQVRGLSECMYQGCWGPLSPRMMAARLTPSSRSLEKCFLESLTISREKDLKIRILEFSNQIVQPDHTIEWNSAVSKPHLSIQSYQSAFCSLFLRRADGQGLPDIWGQVLIRKKTKTKCMGKNNLEERDFVGRRKLTREERKGENSLNAWRDKRYCNLGIRTRCCLKKNNIQRTKRSVGN